MRVLVTGCAGFIGWRVSQLLIQEGHTVVGVDNINDAYDVRLKQKRLEELRPQPGFTFYRLDISDRAQLEQLFTTHREGKFCDTIINLAARAGVRQSLDNPWVYCETNVIGTINLLELSRTYEIQKFVLASTSSLYGSDNPRPFREDANTDRSLSPYAASKKAAEALCYTYHYLYGLDITVLRYFTVYGPAGRPDMSIFRFIKWIAEEEPLQLYGDGTQERDFTYVDDIAKGTVEALKPLGYEIINLGSDHPVLLSRVIAILEELLGKKARIAYLPKQPADVPATWADISKAQKLLGWKPKTSLEDGLQKATEWYLQNRGWAKEIDLL
jgi:nucleoside-diphosphate-sugar epimerase